MLGQNGDLQPNSPAFSVSVWVSWTLNPKWPERSWKTQTQNEHDVFSFAVIYPSCQTCLFGQFLFRRTDTRCSMKIAAFCLFSFLYSNLHHFLGLPNWVVAVKRKNIGSMVASCCNLQSARANYCKLQFLKEFTLASQNLPNRAIYRFHSESSVLLRYYITSRSLSPIKSHI